MDSPLPLLRRTFSLRINADFDEIWRCLAYTRDLEREDGTYWAAQGRLWWSVIEQEHGVTTRSATLFLGINRPDANNIYAFNERRLRLLQGAERWTLGEVYANPETEARTDPEATRIFDEFLDSFERMFMRLGYEVIKETHQLAPIKIDTHSTSRSTLSPEFDDALSQRALALFVGADLPREVTGLPSRADLARELALRRRLDERLALAEVAQRVSQAGNRWEFTAFIRSALETAGKSPQPFHHRIVALVKKHQIETIVTTAYDSLLGLAFQEAGVGINHVVRGSDMSFVTPDHPTLIKLYGDAQQPDTLVVTDRDHSNLLRDREREPLIDEVRRTFRRNMVLILGYNLSDPDFHFLFDEIAESRFSRLAYAVWPGLPEADVRMWRDRGIVILEADPFGVLSAPEAPAAPYPWSGRVDQIPVSPPSIRDTGMDLELGLEALKRLAKGTDWYREFIVHEAALRENLCGGQSYGPSEETCRHRTRIVDQLNALALQHLPISFNDLCLLRESEPNATPEGKGDGVNTGSTPFYGVGNRWAVLVGVDDYDDNANYGRLDVCVKDVHAICDQLVAGGFDPARICLLTDDTPEPPTRDNILTTLRAKAEATEPDDLLLFYYSGHGDEDGGESYLVARNGRMLVLSDTAVRVSRLKRILEEAPARAKVIILDACHSGADIGGKGSRPMTEAFIRRVFEEAEGLAILASCKQGQVSYEWKAQERSVFTHFLLEAWQGHADRDKKGFVTVQDTHRYVTNGVKLWASQRKTSQTPTLQAAVVGDIIVVRYQ